MRRQNLERLERLMKKIKTFGWIWLAGLFLAGCSLPGAPVPTATPTPAGSALAGSHWQLTAIIENGEERPALQTPVVTLQFDEQGQAGGFGGCNSYGGSTKLAGDGIRFENVVSTLMACAEAGVTSQEQAYLAALNAVTQFEVSGDSLTLRSADGQSGLNFERAAANANGSTTSGGLENSAWQLVSMTEGETESQALPGQAVTLQFDAEGRAAGSAGCNRYFGEYSVEDGGLRFGPLASTRMACADEARTRQEQTYLSLMQQVSGYEIRSGELVLTTAGGAGSLVFTRSEAAPQ